MKKVFNQWVEICKLSGEPIATFKLLNESDANRKFEHIENNFNVYKEKHSIKGNVLSEHYTGGTVGFLRLYGENASHAPALRRELYINV